MALTDENMAMDHLNLLDKEYEDQDILSEFLDQRVFDSINANTPVAHGQNFQESDPLESFHNDVFAKLETNSQSGLLDDLDLGFNPENGNVKQEHDGNEYMYMSPHANHSYSLNVSPTHSVVDSQYPYKARSLDDHDMIRKEFSKVKFGNSHMNPCPPTIDVLDPSVLDFSPETMAKLPYQLDVLNLPSSSRVETQIKLRFQMNPPPKETFLHISQDLISKSKFCLQDPVEFLPEVLRKNMLFVETYVLTSDLSKSCNICPRCIKREQKRALRSKTGTSESTIESPTSSIPGSMRNYQNLWTDLKMMKKAIFFNCKEVISFPAPTGLVNDHFKVLDFSARIICYCRHHKEQEGFKLLFVVKNFDNVTVAKHLSNPIMIMDRKKNSASTIKEGSVTQGVTSQSSHVPCSDASNDLDKLHPISPNSIDDSTSEAMANTDTNNDPSLSGRGLKRKKLSFDDSYNSSTNPMFNGSGFSPLSNSDTNASIHNLPGKNPSIPNYVNPITSQNFSQSVLLARQRLLQQLQLIVQSEQQPAIQKIIPSQGPIRGGIEVTLLGFNFRPGLTVKFGSKNALATHCWSESTIVTYLPPAAQPGQVLVSFVDHDHVMVGNQQLIFTYTDDTDRQLIELALQIVGLKMNGKLEDAKNIAKRIVGSDTTNGGSNITQSQPSEAHQESMEWYDNAHKAVEKLSRSDMSTEDILINFLALVDLPNCPIIIPNWQLCNSQGQSLLHLATLRNYSKLVGFLITHGCKIDIKDNQGLTPLFFASMCGFRELINVFIECKSNWNLKLSNDQSLKDYCDLNVLDLFTKLEASNWAGNDDLSSSNSSGSDVGEDMLNRSYSVDSLNSMYMMKYGRHISRMLTDYKMASGDGDKGNIGLSFKGVGNVKAALRKRKALDPYGSDSTDFADSELESEDNLSVELVSRRATWTREVDDEDYYDDYSAAEDENNSDEESQSNFNEQAVTEASSESSKPGLWQMMKTAVFSNDRESPLPSYYDLFPSGDGAMRPKTELERQLNEVDENEGSAQQVYKNPGQQDDTGIASDSSEDMVISYINHPRKAIKNDKMLLFFWLPVLFMIIGLFAYLSFTGYKVELIEKFKEAGRNAIGNVVVGNERLSHVFTKSQIEQVV